jgi:hypothetical protein
MEHEHEGTEWMFVRGLVDIERPLAPAEIHRKALRLEVGAHPAVNRTHASEV